MDKPLTVQDLHGNTIPVWVVDFETFYDTKSKYSLSAKGMTTTLYVRDPRFRAHGLSYTDPDGNSGWVSHNGIQAFFDSIDWTKNAFAAFNTMFDGYIAFEHYNMIPCYYIDIMYMSIGEWGSGERHRLKDVCARLDLEGKIEGELEKTDGIRELSPEQEEALVPYAIRDSEQTREAFELLYFDKGYPEGEMHVIDITLRMFCHPVLEINPALCRAEIEAEDIRINNLLKSDILKDAVLSDNSRAVFMSKGIEGMMRSRDCFAELIRSRGIEPPLKERKKGGVAIKGEYTYAFAKNDEELMSLGEDPRVSDLVALWTGSKSTIRKTRALRFLSVSEDGTKPLSVPLRYCGARTNRWSGFELINLQNLNSGRDGRGSRLRESIMAPKGYRIAAPDLSQVELRCSAWVSDELELLDDLRNGRDPYSKLASEIYGVTVDKYGPHSHLRHVGKEGELSLGFGVGVDKFYNTIKTKYGQDVGEFSMEDAIKVVNLYRKKRTGIISVWSDLKEFIPLMAAQEARFDYKIFTFQDNKILMPSNLRLHYKNLSWHYDKESKSGSFIYQYKKEWTRIYAAKLYENLIQSMARDIVAYHLVEIAKLFRVLSTVHDEILVLVPESEADAALAQCIEIMRKPPAWCATLPLDAEGKHNRFYAK
jgi:DNA polymerase bacteriophage-type